MASHEAPRHIADWREEYQETLQQFAARLDVSISALVNWEHGKVPRRRMKQRIAERLRLRPDQIIYGERDPKTSATAA